MSRIDELNAEFRAMRAAMNTAAPTLSDNVASMTAILFPPMHYDGSLITAGTRINWKGVIKKAAADLWAREENNPDKAPTLWADLDYKDGYRMIPETITVTTKFAKGERGWWTDGKLYESKVDSNVYTPAQYAQNWKLVT